MTHLDLPGQGRPGLGHAARVHDCTATVLPATASDRTDLGSLAVGAVDDAPGLVGNGIVTAGACWPSEETAR